MSILRLTANAVVLVKDAKTGVTFPFAKLSDKLPPDTVTMSDDTTLVGEGARHSFTTMQHIRTCVDNTEFTFGITSVEETPLRIVFSDTDPEFAILTNVFITGFTGELGVNIGFYKGKPTFTLVDVDGFIDSPLEIYYDGFDTWCISSDLYGADINRTTLMSLLLALRGFLSVSGMLIDNFNKFKLINTDIEITL